MSELLIDSLMNAVRPRAESDSLNKEDYLRLMNYAIHATVRLTHYHRVALGRVPNDEDVKKSMSDLLETMNRI